MSTNPHPPIALRRVTPSPVSRERGKQALGLNSPSPTKWGRAAKRIDEGPSAKRWEGEGPWAKRCLFIEGDPILELRQGRDPHCNAPVLGTHPYCARHCLRAYYRPEE